MELGIAIAGILPLALELAKMSKKYYRSFRRAPKEAQRFRTLIEDISDTLAMFCKTARDVEERKIAFAKSRKTKRAVARLKRAIEASIREIRPLLKKLKPLGNRKYPLIRRFIARCKWITGDERDIKDLMVNLNTTKLDVVLLVSMFNTSIQLKIAEQLGEKGQQIPEYLVQEIILLKERNKILNRRYREAVMQRDVLAASNVANNINSREGFASLSRSFGQDVQEIIEEEMPAVEATIEEIVKDHIGSSTIEIITSSTTTDSSPAGNEHSTQDAEENTFKDTTDANSSVGSLSIRVQLGLPEEPTLSPRTCEVHPPPRCEEQRVPSEYPPESGEIDLSQQEELPNASVGQASTSDVSTRHEEIEHRPPLRRNPYQMLRIGGTLVSRYTAGDEFGTNCHEPQRESQERLGQDDPNTRHNSGH